jgi:hypothetical protein
MRTFASFLLLLTACTMYAQPELRLTKLDTQRFEADTFVGYDKFGYAYFIRNNAFIKFKDGQTVEFDNLTTGKITRADILNPLLVVLFYEPFNTAVLLDNQLNEVAEINFNDLPRPIAAHAVGLASQNRLWVYDSLTQQIGLFDYQKKDYRVLTTSFQDNLVYYQSDYNAFRWIDDKGNQFSTDLFGKITTLPKLARHDKIQFFNDGMLYRENGRWFYFDNGKNAAVMIPNVDNSAVDYYVKDQILTIFTGSGITNYKITTP